MRKPIVLFRMNVLAGSGGGNERLLYHTHNLQYVASIRLQYVESGRQKLDRIFPDTKTGRQIMRVRGGGGR